MRRGVSFLEQPSLREKNKDEGKEKEREKEKGKKCLMYRRGSFNNGGT
jgi:hypothetical protein